jgi:UDP-N-acetylglucosamine:LPS N-acetylglucosamine transferase
MPATVLPLRPRPPRIAIVSASVGAGHDGAARELGRRLAGRGCAVGHHDFLDMLPARFGPALRRAYELQLKAAPQTWGLVCGGLERHGATAAAAAMSRLAARRLARALGGQPLDAVVATYPLAAQALARLRRTGRLGAPVVTYLTDLSVHPLWVADGVDAHIALHAVAALQALHLGAAGLRIAAPAVAPQFRPPSSALERRAARLPFGLPDAPLALIAAGSWGVGEVARTAADVRATGVAVPVVVCGRNDALQAEIAAAGAGIALGWVDDMAALMRACDVVVQNAGGLSSLEARATGLPVLSYRCLPGHGTTNAEALAAAGWAPWIRRPADLPAALHAALHSACAVDPGEWGDPADLIGRLAGIGSAETTAAVV